MKAFLIVLVATVELFSNLCFGCQVLERSFPTQLLSHSENYLLMTPDPGVPISGSVYFLHGRGADRHFIRDLGACAEIDRLEHRDGESILIVAPDGGNGYWMNGAHTNEKYRDLVAHELVTQVEMEFPELIQSPAKRIIAGVSMGGHGAIQISLNDPGIFGAIGAHSPVFRTEAEANTDFPEQFGTGLEYQERDPFSLIEKFGKTIPGPIYMDMGSEDPWLRNTRRFESLMQSSNVPGTYQVGAAPGAHENAYWQRHLGEYVDWYEKVLTE